MLCPFLNQFFYFAQINYLLFGFLFYIYSYSFQAYHAYIDLVPFRACLDLLNLLKKNTLVTSYFEHKII